MRRHGNFRRCVRCAAIVAAGIAVGLAARPGIGQGLRYQDANELPEFGTVNVAPVSAFKSNLPVVDNDNLWNFRDFGAGTTVYQSGVSEDSPTLTQTLTGLMPSKSYDLYAVYWTDEDENWTIRTGLSAGSMTFYSWTGNAGAQPVAGSTQGVAAATAPWDVLPPTTKEGTVFTERPADPLVMVLGYAGTASANGSGQLDVLVDDTASIGAGRRTWFDGVAYVDAGTPISVTPSLNRTTGALTLTNTTARNLEIKNYRIESPATGSLNAATWTKISSTNASWTVTMPADPPNTPFTNVLSEDGGGTTVTLAANGGSINFGNVWNKSPFDHVLVYLTLADDTLAVLAANYSGPAIVNGDLDGNGAINLADFQALLNGLQTAPGLTRIENYRRGDMTGDGAINFADWVLFRAAYDAANGAGAFQSMLAQVPEPNSLVILLGMAAIACGYVRQRRNCSRVGVALALCIMWTAMPATALAVDIAIDIDSTRISGADTTGPITTQSGFTSWDLTNVGTSGSTITADGATFEIFGLNAANQSRIRLAAGVPNGGGGTFNNLASDFVFNEGADARAIGLRVSGLPAGTYAVQSWHFDATINPQEATQVEIRNQGDPQDPSQIVLTAAPWSSMAPLEYLLDVTQAGQVKEIIFRESSAGNRARLNAFTIRDPIELTLEVNTNTGATRFLNQQSVSFDMSYYEIRSTAGSLNLGGWSSLDDAEGGDPVGTGWDEVTNSSANILSEVNLQSMTSFAPGNSTSLGNAFTVGGTQDLRFFYASPTATSLRQGVVKYVTGPSGIAGDYNANGTVDAADYVLWRKNLNTSTTLPNDTTPGMVTQADYTVWRANFGKTPGSGAEIAANAPVPEPSMIGLAIAGVSMMVFGRLGRCSQTPRRERAA